MGVDGVVRLHYPATEQELALMVESPNTPRIRSVLSSRHSGTRASGLELGTDALRTFEEHGLAFHYEHLGNLPINFQELKEVDAKSERRLQG